MNKINNCLLTIYLSILFSSYFINALNNNYDDVDMILNENSPCLGDWRYPSNCSGFNCDYKATWQYQDESDEIIFTISTKNRNKWTGIGFSDNPYMSNTDAILGLVEESGRFFLMDSYLLAYEAPPLDYQQNLYNMSAWRENGLTTLRFSRPRQTGDVRDYQFSDTDCPYFMFPVMGGVFNAVNKRIRKHESTPIISEEKICVHSCRIASPKILTTTTAVMPTTTSASSPSSNKKYDHNNKESINDNDNNDIISNLPQSENELNTSENRIRIYQVEMKFLNLVENNKQTPMNELFRSIENDLSRELRPNFNGIKKIEINELKMDSNKNIVIVDLTIQSPQDDKNEKDDIRALNIALNTILKDGHIGRWTVDPNHIVVIPKEDKSDGWMNILLSSFNRFSEEEQRWIIIGAGLSALLLLALIQLLCMFCSCGCCGCRKNQSTQEDYIDEKDDKQWVNDPYQSSMFNGLYNPEDPYGYQGKSNSLHKNYRGQHNGNNHDPRSMQPYMNGHHHSGYGHQSLDRRHYQEQQEQPQHVRRQQISMGYEMNERQQQHQHQYHNHHHHHNHRGPNGQQLQHSNLQPDFYFMPHQRKYSSDVVRVFVDYEGN